MSNSVTTFEAKHIFLDIVNYTHNRSIEAQTELIAVLNKIVKQSITKNRIKSDSVIYIPTGDGICISLVDVSKPFDIHILLALDILEKLHNHNISTQDDMRKFNLRIGINDNIDNLVIDINKQKNVSGSGINFAARILSLCDANQILVSNSVFDKLVQREKYITSFKNYIGEVKHGVKLSVYQYRNPSYPFLNNSTPSSFVTKPKSIAKLSALAAYYITNCINQEEFISKNLHDPQNKYTLIYLLFHLAQDSLATSQITKTHPRATIKTKRPIQEEFTYLQSVDYWLIADLDSYVKEFVFPDLTDYFQDGLLFVNERGRQKLIEDYPAIAKEFNITEKTEA
jgi:hypothetical protein